MAGFTPEYWHIKKKAMPAWFALCEAQDENPYYPCKNNPFYYTDYEGPGLEPLTIDMVESLCADCPLLKQCYDFAVANEEKHGIWGGVSFYKDKEILDE